MDADKELIAAYMHHAGAHSGTLPSEVFYNVYCAGNGFGKLSPEALAEINDGYDWSHIRDSSPDAIRNMADVLKNAGYTLEGPSARPGP